MNDNAEVHNWWAGLTPEQRQAAHHAARTGEVNDQVWATLVEAELVEPADENRTLSDPLAQQILKMQHD